MKATPPMGVMAPSMRLPVTASRYRLPEKITMPASRTAQTVAARGFGKRAGARQNGDDQNPQRVDEVVEDRLFVDAHGIVVQAAAQPVRAKRAQDHGQRQQNGSRHAPVHRLAQCVIE